MRLKLTETGNWNGTTWSVMWIVYAPCAGHGNTYCHAIDLHPRAVTREMSLRPQNGNFTPQGYFWEARLSRLLETDWFEINTRSRNEQAVESRRTRINLVAPQDVCFRRRNHSRWRRSAISWRIWRRTKRNGWKTRIWSSKAAERRHLRGILRKRKATWERCIQVNKTFA